MRLPLFSRLSCIFKTNKKDHTAVNWLSQETASEAWGIGLLQRQGVSYHSSESHRSDGRVAPARGFSPKGTAGVRRHRNGDSRPLRGACALVYLFLSPV